MNNLTVAPFSAAHLDAVCEMEQRIFSDEPWSRAAFESELSNPASLNLTALWDGEAAGYLMTTCVLDEVHINTLASGEKFRRRGVAQALMRELLVMAKARGVTHLSLEVRESNLPAIRLYEKMGFFPVGRRARFYRAPAEDALLMIRE